MKQYITLEQFERLNLSDSALFMIDANVSIDYLMKDLEVQKSDLNAWIKERKPLINEKSYQYEMIKKLNAIRIMDLITNFINHNFWCFDQNEDSWTIQLFHDIDCEAPSETKKELIDVLYELLLIKNNSLCLHFTGEI